jgi:NADPH-dependent 2,4-dienoyl-CoA reductase/sulfur reductase-like enzyme/nitrite reductase/ring-hydroxylating ferredoxin subunit
MSERPQPTGPDFRAGVARDAVPDGGTLAGRVGDEPVLLSRFGGELCAVGGLCTHYGAALAGGLFDGQTVRCPLHHACFNLRGGDVLRAPALDPLDRWQVEVEAGRVFVRRKLEPAATARADTSGVQRVVIVGGGAAGLACASELRRLGYSGAIAILSSDRHAPYDRPNLSKDYLAGTAPEEWLLLRDGDWYAHNRIELQLGVEVQGVDAEARTVRCSGGEELGFDRLLIATGSEPRRLGAPGFDAANVFTLRSMADAAALAAQARAGARAAIIGSSFIGMEAAAALRKRGVEVTIVSPEEVPFKAVLGPTIGAFLQRLHEANGVCFRLGMVAASFHDGIVKLAKGGTIAADFVIVGVGVQPRTGVAQSAGIHADGAVPVDEFLETPVPGIFAAGDIAEYPDPLSGERVRIEHWVTAERQGQAAAANMLGPRRPFRAVPFFWTEQFGVALRYVGHAATWDRIEVDGDVDRGDFIARYYDAGVHRASAAIGRDGEILADEQRFERATLSGRG